MERIVGAPKKRARVPHLHKIPVAYIAQLIYNLMFAWTTQIFSICWEAGWFVSIFHLLGGCFVLNTNEW